MREYRGVVKNGVVLLEDGQELPDGTVVRVVVEEATQEFVPDWSKIWALVGKARDIEGKTDVSERVDEYLAEGFLRREHDLKPQEGDGG